MLKPFTRSYASRGQAGYSMVELLVASTVSLAVTAGALSLALTSRSLYQVDQARVRLNENLRAGKDFLVTDLHQVGERLSPTFPAVEIIRGEDLPGGSAGDPDELVVRRNLLSTVLRVCDPVVTTSDDVVVAVEVGAPPGCAPLPVDPGDTYPTNIDDWSDYRIARGGLVKAYIYDAATGDGEFFDYDTELEEPDYFMPGEGAFVIRKTLGSPDWANAYPVGSGQLFLLEERRYRLATDGVLQMVVDQNAAAPVNLVDSIVDFQLRALMKPTLLDPTPSPIDTFAGGGWTGLAWIEVTLDGRTAVKDRFIDHGWSTTVVPRNAF